MAEEQNIEERFQEFVRKRSERAFRALVDHYRGLVFSTALRQLNGDTHLAEDATQKVFTDFATKATQLKADGSLGGWLHCHTCFVCSDLRRGEQRRKRREQTAAELNTNSGNPNQWLDAEAELDNAINDLKENDRRVIIARFFEKQSLKTIGQMFDATDRAAHMRVNRAVERLRDLLGKRGVTIPLATLGAGMLNSASATPSLSNRALSTAALGGGTSNSWFALLPAGSKTAAAFAAVIATWLLWPNKTEPKVPTVQDPIPNPRSTAAGISTGPSSTPAIAHARANRQSRRSQTQRNPSNTHSLTIEFVDAETGNPIPNFQFRRYWIEGTTRSGVVRANTNGNWTMTRPREHFSWIAISTHCDGWVNEKVEWNHPDLQALPSRRIYEARRAVKLGGRVLTETGEPIRRAWVSTTPDSRTMPFPWEVSATTDSNGYWEIQRVAPELVAKISLRAGHDIFPASHRADLDNATVRETMLNGAHAFTLSQGRSMSGTVVTEDGLPVARGYLNATQIWPDGDKSSSGHCRFQNGEFEIRTLGQGRNVLSFSALGFAGRRILVDVGETNSPLAIVLERGRSIRFKVTDNLGYPLPGASFLASKSKETQELLSAPTPSTAPPQAFYLTPHKARTDINGFLTASNIPTIPFNVEVRCEGYQTNVIPVSSDQTRATVVMQEIDPTSAP